MSITETVPLEADVFPDVYITATCFSAQKRYLHGYDKGAHTHSFQYFELFNYSDEPVDLREYQAVYTYRDVDYPMNWVFEQGNDGILRPGEIYVCGVFNGYTAEGDSTGTPTFTYDTETGKTTYWNAFNEFFGVNVPLTNRAILPFLDSDMPVFTSSYDSVGRTRISNSSVGYLQMKHNGETVNKVHLYVKNGGPNISHQYFPVDSDFSLETAPFVTGAFPYSLLPVQDPNYQQSAVTSAVSTTKVVSYNLLSSDDEVDGVIHTLSARQPLFIKSIQAYAPDIIGLQEITYAWRDYLYSNLTGYSCVKPLSTQNRPYDEMYSEKEVSMPIFYRTDKYELLEQGNRWLTENGVYYGPTWGDSDYTKERRNMVWAVLRDKTTGEIFNVINTHLGLYGNIIRAKRIELMIQKGEQLQALYGGAIIIMGDTNIAENHAMLRGFDGHLVNAKFQTLNFESLGTCTNFEHNSKNFTHAIDHIYVNNVYVEKYRVMDEMYEIPEDDGYRNECPSDHYGIYAEIVSKGYEDETPPVITGIADGDTICGDATFTLSEDNVVTATLDGIPIRAGQHTVTQKGVHRLVVTDVAGYHLEVTFTTENHNYQSVVTPPSCTAGGYTTKTCDKCGYSFKEAFTPVTHAPGQWQTVSEPTYLKEGLKEQHCTKCNTLLDSRALSALQGTDVLTVFTDIKAKDWYYKNRSIYYVYNQGLFKGATSTAFAPRQSMDRGMFVTVLGRLYGVDTSKIDPATQFTDVSVKKYYVPYVKWAYQNGIVKGMSDTTFAPLALITREQICAMLVRYCEYADISLGRLNPPLTFTDGNKISKYARKGNARLIQGKTFTLQSLARVSNFYKFPKGFQIVQNILILL